MSEDVEPTTASRLDGSEIARRVMDRAGKGEIDLRVVSSAMGEAWDQDFASAILRAALSTPAPADASGPFEFERYVNGVKMAQGITIERETALQAAMRRAVELCPKYQGTVLVLAPPASPTPPRPIDMGEIERALEPFSKAADVKLCAEPGYWSDEKSIKNTDVASGITFGDLRRARQALAAIKGEGA